MSEVAPATAAVVVVVVGGTVVVVVVVGGTVVVVVVVGGTVVVVVVVGGPWWWSWWCEGPWWWSWWWAGSFCPRSTARFLGRREGPGRRGAVLGLGRHHHVDPGQGAERPDVERCPGFEAGQRRVVGGQLAQRAQILRRTLRGRIVDGGEGDGTALPHSRGHEFDPGGPWRRWPTIRGPWSSSWWLALSGSP